VRNVSQEFVAQGSRLRREFARILVVRQSGQCFAEGDNINVNVHDGEGLLIRLVKAQSPYLDPVELQHCDDVTNYHQEHDDRERRFQKRPDLPLPETKVIPGTSPWEWFTIRDVRSRALCHPSASNSASHRIRPV
jgi:hypothetical protein